MPDLLTNSAKTRYSDEELNEFNFLIELKLTEARAELKLLKEALVGNPNDTQGTFSSFKVLEEANEVASKEENSKLAIRQERFIQNLENARLRIKNKTYGVCAVTGKLISKERLRSVPHATKSVEGKMILEVKCPKNGNGGTHQLQELSSHRNNYR